MFVCLGQLLQGVSGELAPAPLPCANFNCNHLHHATGGPISMTMLSRDVQLIAAGAVGASAIVLIAPHAAKLFRHVYCTITKTPSECQLC